MKATGTISLLGCAMLLLAMVVGGCSVTEPEGPTTVADFSWPTTPNLAMTYKKESKNPQLGSVDTTEEHLTIQRSKSQFKGNDMFELYDTVSSASARTRFLPLNDTLIVYDNLGCQYALVGTMEKGGEWYSPRRGFADDKPSWHAKIIERYDFKRVEGKTYKNVIAVQYTEVDSNKVETGKGLWVRLFAEGVGVVQEVSYSYPISSGGTTQVGQDPDFDLLRQEARRVLIQTDAVQN